MSEKDDTGNCTLVICGTLADDVIIS